MKISNSGNFIAKLSALSIQKVEGGIPFGRRNKKPTIIVLHHTVTRSWQQTLRAFQSKNRTASTHYEIEKDGTIYQYLDPATQTAWHCVGRNFESIGIDLTHMTGEPFDEAQIRALVLLLRHLSAQFGIELVYDSGRFYLNGTPKKDLPLRGGTVYGHGQLSPTQCPDGLDIESIVRVARGVPC